MRQEPASHDPDGLISRIAARQHGVVSLAQLESAGIQPRSVTRRIQANRLHRVHRGVYAVGHDGLSPEGLWMAAVKACGQDAVLSHRSAGELWRMLPLASLEDLSPPSPIHVTVPTHGGREHREGIAIHRSATLLPSHCTIRNAIPVTKAARTREDLRRTASKEVFSRAMREAQFRRLPIGAQFKPDGTRSELEARYLALSRRHRLPLPDVNARVGPFTVDFLYPAQRLIVEVDGWRAHGTQAAFEEDRARDVRLKLMGYTVVRFTWRQVTEDGAGVAATVRGLLGA